MNRGRKRAMRRLKLPSVTLLTLPLLLLALLLLPRTARAAGAATPVLQDLDAAPAPDATIPAGTAPFTTTFLLPLVSTDAHLYVAFAGTRSNFQNENPAFGSTRRSLNAYLQWQLPTATEETRYTIWMEADDTTPDVLIAHDLTRPSFDPQTYQTNTTYYWQVVAMNGDTVLERSPVWHFSTDYFPEIPELDAMVRVPAGEFVMGCDWNNPGMAYCKPRELPLHRVWISEFEISKFEVTNLEYRECVEAGVCNPPRRFGTHEDISYFDNTEYDYYPVLFTSNLDARTFCGWKGKRIPTEAEWEKAARGAIDTRPWPWGFEPFDCSRANTEYCTGDPQRVDSFVINQSPYGAVNMSGNVHEWLQDFYLDDYYEWSPYKDPVNTKSQKLPYYSARGGDYRPNWYYSRVTNRNAGHHGDDDGSDDRPLFRSFRVGIRCARSVESAAALEYGPQPPN